MKRIILLLLLLPLAIAEEKNFDTDLNITIENSTSTLSIKTESSDYSFSCLNSQNTTKTINIRRNVSTIIQGCTEEVTSLASTCNRTVSKIDAFLDDSTSYAKLYNTCINEKNTLVTTMMPKTECDEVKTDLSNSKSSVTALTSERDVANNNNNQCIRERDEVNKKLSDKEQFYLQWWFLLIGGGAIGYFGNEYLRKRKQNPTTQYEKTMGESMMPPDEERYK